MSDFDRNYHCYNLYFFIFYGFLNLKFIYVFYKKQYIFRILFIIKTYIKYIVFY